jgi:hypothetical protein
LYPLLKIKNEIINKIKNKKNITEKETKRDASLAPIKPYLNPSII